VVFNSSSKARIRFSRVDTSEALKALLLEQPNACQELLTMLTAKIVQTDEVTRAMLGRKSDPGPELALA
jgi:hypothetical protein